MAQHSDLWVCAQPSCVQLRVHLSGREPRAVECEELGVGDWHWVYAHAVG